MKINTAKPSLLLLLTHILLCMVAFYRHFSTPLNAIFCTWGDGLRNYFALQTFVESPIGKEGIFKYDQFAYPYGDFVYYTDNTPLFSIPFRWFCAHILDISTYAIPCFNFFVIANIVIGGLVSFWVFRKIFNHVGISFWLAVVLPWVNPQVLKIFFGHFNLSFSSVIIITIALFLLWYQNRNNIRNLIFVSIIAVFFTTAAFLCHAYYFAIVTSFLFFLLFFSVLFSFKEKGTSLRMLIAILVPIITIILVMTIVYYTDKYFNIRKETAMGYDYDKLKMQLHFLFTHYPFHKVFFPIQMGVIEDNYEQNAYLGNIGLFFGSVIALGCMFSRAFFTQVINIQKEFFSNPIRKSIVFAGLVLLLISFGDYYSFFPISVKIGLPFDSSKIGILYQIVIYVFLLMFAIISTVLARKHYPTFYQKRKRILIGFALLLMLALVIKVLTQNYTFKITNILNPFYYVHLITNRVEQFRYLSRFSWPFYWVFYIWLMFTVVKLYQQSTKATQGFIWVLLIFLGGFELTDNIINLRKRANKENPFSTKVLTQFQSLNINYQDFQAILPIPFFIGSSEDYNYTIDDEDNHSSFVMQLAMVSELPQMSSKLGRTPPWFSIEMLDFVSNDFISSDLKRRMNNKPILIVINAPLAKDTNAAYIPNQPNPLPRQLCLKALTFVERHNLQAIDSLGDYYFYSYKMP